MEPEASVVLLTAVWVRSTEEAGHAEAKERVRCTAIEGEREPKLYLGEVGMEELGAREAVGELADSGKCPPTRLCTRRRGRRLGRVSGCTDKRTMRRGGRR